MAAMTTLRDIVNDDPADATDVEFNFNTIEGYISSDVIKRDGTTAMAAPLTLQAGAPTDGTHAANKAYVDAVLPVGIMLEYAADALASGMAASWLICDGTVVNQSEWPALFALIGTTYNTGGEGGGQFRLPDHRRRVTVGRDSVTAPFDACGNVGGQASPSLPTHTHTGPSHTHTGPSHTHTGPSHTHSTPNHTHSGTAASAGAHTHDSGHKASSHLFESGSNAYSNVNFGSTVNTSSAGAHTHSVSISSGGGGTSGASGTGNTGASGTGNTGAAGTGATGATGEASVTNHNYSPYTIVTKIIKAA